MLPTLSSDVGEARSSPGQAGVFLPFVALTTSSRVPGRERGLGTGLQRQPGLPRAPEVLQPTPTGGGPRCHSLSQAPLPWAARVTPEELGGPLGWQIKQPLPPIPQLPYCWWWLGWGPLFSEWEVGGARKEPPAQKGSTAHYGHPGAHAAPGQPLPTADEAPEP